MPSCDFAPAFLWHERASLQGFDPRTELPAIVERSQAASTGFPSRVFSSAALAHGFDPGPSSRALSASSTCVGTACGAPESCVAAESACRFRLPTLMGSSTSRSRGVPPPRPIPVLKDRRLSRLVQLVERAFATLFGRLRAPVRASLRDGSLLPRHRSLDQHKVPGNLGKNHDGALSNGRSSEHAEDVARARDHELRRRLHNFPQSTGLWITSGARGRAVEFRRTIRGATRRARSVQRAVENRWISGEGTIERGARNLRVRVATRRRTIRQRAPRHRPSPGPRVRTARNRGCRRPR